MSNDENKPGLGCVPWSGDLYKPQDCCGSRLTPAQVEKMKQYSISGLFYTAGRIGEGFAEGLASELKLKPIETIIVNVPSPAYKQGTFEDDNADDE